MKISNLVKLLGIMLAFTIVACGPSTKNETKKWETAKKNATTYKTEYPNFATVIETQMKSADTAMTAALKIGDEEKKAKSMQSANDIAGKVVGRISEVKSKIKSLESAMDKLGKLKIPKSKAGTRNRAFDTGNAAITSVRDAMAKAAPTNVEEAEVVLKAQVSELISAKGSVDRAHDSLKPKKKKKKKKKKKN